MKYLKLLRVKHYIKNLLIFLPIIFGKQLLDLNTDLKVMVGFFSFSLMASVIYILNDIKDLPKDRIHSKKRERPIASGEVSVRTAYVIVVLLFCTSILLNSVLMNLVENQLLGWSLLIGYLINNVVYSLFNGKAIPLLDVVLLMNGFVIRVYYGAAISGIPVSNWMCLVVCSGSFYMGFGKRRNELNRYADSTRDVLKYYTKEFLDHVMNCCMTLIITFYSLWVMTLMQDGQSVKYIWSIPMIMIILFKYSLDVENPNNEGGGDPVEVILSDWSLIVLVVLFLMYLGNCLYSW